MPSKKIKISQPVAIILAAVILSAIIIFTNYLKSGQYTQLANADQQLPANVHVRGPSSTDHILGNPKAPIVLIEYTDFQCPYCSILYPTLKKIVSDSNGQIAWVIRNFPLYQIHPQAEIAANAAECIAEQTANSEYWTFADTVFTNQDLIGPNFYSQIALQAGLNMQQYSSCVTAKKYQSNIDTDLQEVELNGGRGTPFTVVYGHGKEIPISGALPYAQINSIIQSVQAQ